MRYLFLICFLFFAGLFSGCVEDTNLTKYDKYYNVSFEKVSQIEKVELPEAEDQSSKKITSVVNVNPGDINKLTLEDCRVLALQNNLEMQVLAYRPQIARESLKSAHARFEPSFIAGFSYAMNDYPEEYTETKNLDYYAQLQMPMITGGRLSFNMPLSKTETQGTYYYNDEFTGQLVTFDSQNTYYNSNVRMQLSQPLLRGAGTDVNTHSIRLASYNFKSSMAQGKLSAMMVIKGVETAYWNLYYAQEVLKVREMDYELAKAQYERTRRMLEQNKAMQIDLLRAESTMSQKEAGMGSAYRNLRITRRALKQVLNAEGLEVDSDSIVEAVSEPVAVKYELDKGPLLEYAMENRMELLDYELQLASQESTLDFDKNSLLPYLSLDYTYSFRAMGSTFSGTMDMLDNRALNDHRVGMSLTVPLGNRAAKAAYRGSLLAMERLKLNKQQQEITIKNDVLSAIEELEAGWNDIVTMDNSVKIALRAYEAEQRQYDLGVQNYTELLLARNTYLGAMLERLSYLVKYQNLQVNLCYQVGGLNEAARLGIE